MTSDRLHGASWPVFRAGPARTGAASEQARPGLVPRWNYRIQGSFLSSPVVSRGIVYCGSQDASVWAWDAKTGEVVWQYSTSGAVDATPCVSSTTVFAPSRDGNVYAFDRLTGDLKWQACTGSKDCSSPVLSEGKLYLLSGLPEKKVYCIDAESGTMTASYPVSQFSFSSPALQDRRLFFGTNDGAFHCLDLQTGQINWTHPTSGGIFFSSLSAGSEAVFAVSGGDERRLFALNLQTGATIWRSAELDANTASVSSVALSDDKVFVACSLITEIDPGAFDTGLVLHAFPRSASSQNVAPLWTAQIGYPDPSGVVSSPAVAGEVVYIGSGDGFLYCINAADGRYVEPATGNLTASPTAYYLCYSQSASSSIIASPAVSDGWVYAGTTDGNFWGLESQQAAYVSFPDNDEIVTDRVSLKGDLRGAGPGYTIELGAGDQPASWTAIVQSTAGVSAEDLGAWNTSGLADGSYSIRLAAAGNASFCAINRFAVDNSPQPPAKLVAADTPFDGGGSISLSWELSADDGKGDNDVAGYRIYKSACAGGYTLLAEIAKGTTVHIDTACPVYSTYYFVMTAIDSRSESAWSGAAGACSLADGIEIDPATGGTVTMEKDGLATEIVIEPGALPARAWLGILAPSSYPGTGPAQSIRGTPCVREFGITPAGTHFLKPVTIKIPYRPQDVAGMKAENLRIYWWDPAKAEWRIVNTSNPGAESGRVWATVPHFSLYRIMEYAPGSEELLSGDKVYTYPNPATGATVFFKYYPGDKADVSIDLYNVAGELVAHLEKAGNPAGLVSELEWNISGIASGVYVYRIEAKAGGRSKAVKKKLAIIH